MTGLSLSGCFILVVEDEPLIALDIAECLQAEAAWFILRITWRTAAPSGTSRSLGSRGGLRLGWR